MIPHLSCSHPKATNAAKNDTYATIPYMNWLADACTTHMTAMYVNIAKYTLLLTPTNKSFIMLCLVFWFILYVQLSHLLERGNVIPATRLSCLVRAEYYPLAEIGQVVANCPERAALQLNVAVKPVQLYDYPLVRVTHHAAPADVADDFSCLPCGCCHKVHNVFLVHALLVLSIITVISISLCKVTNKDWNNQKN